MDTLKFEQRLAELLKEFGCEMTTRVTFDIHKPSYYESDFSLRYTRRIEPIRISFSAEANACSEWRFVQ